MTRKALFLTLYFLSPLIPIAAILSSNPTRYADLNSLAAMGMGAAAYTWLVAEFVLSARPKFIEKYYGLDRFYRFHGIMAVISVSLAVLHKLIEESIMGKFFTTVLGDRALYVFIAVVILALLFMADSVLLRIKPLFYLRIFFQKIGLAGYEIQVALHNLSIVGLVLLLIHVMHTYAANTNKLVAAAYILYFSVGAGFYLYHRFIRIIILSGKRYIVREVVQESSSIWTVKLISEKGKTLQYKPGQFGFFRLLKGKPGRGEHPFSFSSDPSDKDGLSITIKALGDYTSKIGLVKKGDIALMDAPYGRFSYLDYPCHNGVVFIAGGVGITPVLSMLRYMASQDKECNVTLFWGVNDRSELIWLNELEEIKYKVKKLKIIPVVLKDEMWHGERGTIDREKLERILKSGEEEILSKQYFICGPVKMLGSVVSSLKALGIDRKRIHFERFSL